MNKFDLRMKDLVESGQIRIVKTAETDKLLEDLKNIGMKATEEQEAKIEIRIGNPSIDSIFKAVAEHHQDVQVEKMSYNKLGDIEEVTVYFQQVPPNIEVSGEPIIWDRKNEDVCPAIPKDN